MKKKKLLIVVAPVSASIVIAGIIIGLHNNIMMGTYVNSIVSNEMKVYKENISSLNREKERINGEIAQADEFLKTNEDLVSEVESLNDSLTSYNNDISAAKKKNENLKTQISDKKNYLEKLSELKTETVGDAKKLSEGEYKCPAQLDAGRYKAEGSGKIYLYNIAHTLKENLNLATIDTHSYTFEIASGESLRVEGDVKLTNINN